MDVELNIVTSYITNPEQIFKALRAKSTDLPQSTDLFHNMYNHNTT